MSNLVTNNFKTKQEHHLNKETIEEFLKRGGKISKLKPFLPKRFSYWVQLSQRILLNVIKNK